MAEARAGGLAVAEGWRDVRSPERDLRFGEGK